MTSKPADFPVDESYDGTVWITPCWDDWWRSGESSRMVDEAKAVRAYEHWHLAVELASADADDVRRGTVVQKLWNAVESRTRLLHAEYRLQDLKRVMEWTRGKPDTLEVLSRMGLARQLVLRELKDIRNSVEHADRDAPSHARCLSYIDSVWYFLRSTDVFVSRRVTSFGFESTLRDHATSEANLLFVEFNFDDGDWLPRLYGRFPRSAVRAASSEEALEIRLDQPVHMMPGDVLFVSGKVTKTSVAARETLSDYFLVDLPDSRRTTS